MQTKDLLNFDIVNLLNFNQHNIFMTQLPFSRGENFKWH